MSTPLPIDQEYERAVVKKADRGEGGWTVEREDGWSLWVVDNGIEPEPGDVMRCYGRGIGHAVRGIAVEGKGVVRYQTAAEEQAAHEAWVAQWKRDQIDRLETERADRDLRVRALPRGLRLRIERFQATRPDWRAEHEPYELFVCEEAARLAAHFDGENAVYRLNEWAEFPWEQQKAAWPELSDEHSGNTFGASVSLARLVLLGNDEHVIRSHGALCPLTGCQDYGCYAAYPEPALEGQGNPQSIQGPDAAPPVGEGRRNEPNRD